MISDSLSSVLYSLCGTIWFKLLTAHRRYSCFLSLLDSPAENVPGHDAVFCLKSSFRTLKTSNDNKAGFSTRELNIQKVLDYE